VHFKKSSINVLYEDENVIVFDKPAELLVIPAMKRKENTLVDIVNKQYSLTDASKLHPCHRLDRETSGAIIFAKGKKNQKILMNLFNLNEIEKKYIAFVQGRVRHETGKFVSKIRDFDDIKYRNHGHGKTAETQYKLLEARKNFSIVEVKTLTGRTNQIRIHFSKNGHPLVGDRKYSFPRDYIVKFRRTALHAAYLSWISPATSKRIEVFSDIPKDMRDFLKVNT